MCIRDRAFKSAVVNLFICLELILNKIRRELIKLLAYEFGNLNVLILLNSCLLYTSQIAKHSEKKLKIHTL